MSVRETQSERCLSGLIILFLLVIGTSTRGNAQQYDYTNTESEPALDATLGSPKSEGPELPTFPEVIAETDTEPETLPEIEAVLETDLPSLEEGKPEEEEDAPDNKVEATPWGDPETDAPIKPKVAEIDATAQAEPESDAASETPAKLDATATAVKEAAEPVAETSTQPEPDAQLTTRPKDKKKKKSKKKSRGDPETDASIKPKVAEIDATAQAEPESDPASKTLAKLDATAPASTQPEPDAQLTTGPKDKKQKKSKKKSDKKKKKKKKKKKTTEKAKSTEPTTEIKPTEPQPLEPQPTEPKPVEPQPVDSKPVERKPVERKPVELKPVEPKPVEPKPEKPQIEEKVYKEKVEKKPEEPVTQGPCIDIYTNAQKRQACPGGWKDRVRILNLQVGKLKKDNEKLWMQVTGIHGKIEYSRRMISESHLSTNAWKKRVSFPYATSDEEVKVDVTDCSDALGKGNEKPGVYLLNPNGSPYNVRALCVNGWTVVQRRFDGSEDFNRDFDDYVSGFGNFSGEFFLGLENLFRLADKKAYTLRVDAKGSSGKWYYGVYEDFNLLDETDEYRLSLGNMSSGNYFDGFENGRDQQFSTRDRDNDKWRGGNCAEHYGGGWWSGRCSSNLNQMWCRSGCLRWASKPVVSSIIRIKPSSAVVEEDLSENPNPAGLTLDETPV